jgi:hypothetical protein
VSSARASRVRAPPPEAPYSPKGQLRWNVLILPGCARKRAGVTPLAGSLRRILNALMSGCDQVHSLPALRIQSRGSAPHSGAPMDTTAHATPTRARPAAGAGVPILLLTPRGCPHGGPGPAGWAVSEVAAEYVRIHVTRRIYRNRIDQALMDWLALIADDKGVARAVQEEMAYGIRAHLKSIEKSIRRLKSPDDGDGAVIERLTGRRWGIIGVEGHDESRCHELECQAKAAFGAGAAKRRRAAERARRARAKKRACGQI